MIELSYDELPYESVPIPYTAPFAVAWNARAQAGLEAPLGAVRVLEIGCGDGTNLVPLAFYAPDSEWVGIDASARAIGAAHATTNALGLANLRFERTDLATFGVDAGSFDFVIAHGLYSWIDPERRVALRELIARALAPHGLAVVSFNSEPGWSVRGRVRDALRAGGCESLAAARERIVELREAVGHHAWGTLLRHELDRANAASDAYLAHEYLAPHNGAFWVSEVSAAFAQHDLHVIGDALADRREGYVDPQLVARSQSWTDDPIAQSELVDLIGYRQLRAAIVSKRPPAVGDRSWDGVLVASAARALGEPFDPSHGVDERFFGMRDREFELTDARLKIAMLVLASTYPAGHTVPALRARCDVLLAEYGVRSSASGFEDALFELHRAGEIEARLIDPPLRTTASVRPEASALTRHEAQHRRAVTTGLHTELPLHADDRAIVTRMDGTRTRDELGASEDLIARLEWWGLVR